MVFIPVLSVTVEPAFGNGADEAAAGGDVQMFGVCIVLSEGLIVDHTFRVKETSTNLFAV
jgi:hypothetical protein